MSLRVELDEELFPVQAFLNAISTSSFVRTVEALADGVGSSFNDAGCQMPGDLDPGEPAFEGVRCWVLAEVGKAEEEATVDRETFKRCMEQACAAYLKDHPADRPRIEAALARFKP